MCLIGQYLLLVGYTQYTKDVPLCQVHDGDQVRIELHGVAYHSLYEIVAVLLSDRGVV